MNKKKETGSKKFNISGRYIMPQDLHIHTVFSTGDSAVAPEQTVEFIAELKHAKSIGISDHFEYLIGGAYDNYVKTLRHHEFHVGTEVDGNEWVDMSLQYEFDYYIYPSALQLSEKEHSPLTHLLYS